MGACSKKCTCNTAKPFNLGFTFTGPGGGLGRTWRFQQQNARNQFSLKKSQLFSVNFQRTWAKDMGALSNRMQGLLLEDSEDEKAYAGL